MVPTVPVVGAAVFVTPKSTDVVPVVPVTGVTTVATLFARFRSGVVLATVAVLTKAPGVAGAVMVKVNVAVPPGAKVPIVSVATLPTGGVKAPALFVPVTPVTPAGKTSTTVTPAADVVVSLFLTVTV